MSAARINGLTANHEAFAKIVAAGKLTNMSDCYRAAYPRCKGNPEYASSKAYTLLQHPRIKARIAELRDEQSRQLAQSTVYSRETAMRRLQEAWAIGVEKKNAGWLTKIVELEARLHGLMVEERKNERSPVDDLDAPAVQSMLDTIAAIRKAKNFSILDAEVVKTTTRA